MGAFLRTREGRLALGGRFRRPGMILFVPPGTSPQRLWEIACLSTWRFRPGWTFAGLAYQPSIEISRPTEPTDYSLSGPGLSVLPPLPMEVRVKVEASITSGLTFQPRVAVAVLSSSAVSPDPGSVWATVITDAVASPPGSPGATEDFIYGRRGGETAALGFRVEGSVMVVRARSVRRLLEPAERGWTAFHSVGGDQERPAISMVG